MKSRDNSPGDLIGRELLKKIVATPGCVQLLNEISRLLAQWISNANSSCIILRIDYRHTAFVHHMLPMPLCLVRIVCIWHLRIYYRHAAFMHHNIVSMPLCLIRTTAFMHHIVSMPLCLLRIVCIWHLRIYYRYAAFMHHIVPMPLCLIRSTAFVHHMLSMPLCLLRIVCISLCMAFAH